MTTVSLLNNTKEHLITPNMLYYKRPITFDEPWSECTTFICNIETSKLTRYQTF